MNKKISGFWTVYKYTLKSQMKSKKYILTTAIITLVIVIGIMAAMFFFLKNKEDNTVNVKKIDVFDETGMGVVDYKTFAKYSENENLANASYNEVKDAKKAFEENKEDDSYVLAVQTKTEDGYSIKLIPSKANKTKTSTLEGLAMNMSCYFQSYLYSQQDLTNEELSQLLMQVDVQVDNIGKEDSSDGKEIVLIIITFFNLILVYFMVLFYGQQVCAYVSMEKITKIIEQLLVTIKPYGLVSGKVLGMISICIIQFLIWIVAFPVGIFLGDKFLYLVNDEYTSIVTELFNYIKQWFGTMSFNPLTIIMAVLIIIAGIVLYLSLAGLGGSMITKPEEAGTMQTVFIIPLIIAYFVLITQVTKYEGVMPAVFNYIPFTSAMLTPGAVLLGQCSILESVISLLITVLLTVLILFISAKIYKMLLFYSGKKLTVGKVIKMFFKKKSVSKNKI